MWDDRQPSWPIDHHRLHFMESISRITSEEATMAACNPFIFWMFVSTRHLHPEAVDREGRRSIIDRDDRHRDDQSSIGTIGVGRWRSLFSATASSPHQYHLTMCFSIVVNLLFITILRAK
jgi:hypothetical protein